MGVGGNPGRRRVLNGDVERSAAFVSDWFVSALEPATASLHMSQTFAGLVVVAIAGNAVENVVGVQLALRNRPDFAISVIVNSSLQVALALTPVILFASLFFATSMTLVFPTLLAVSLLLAAFVTAVVVYDGESTWPEGVRSPLPSAFKRRMAQRSSDGGDRLQPEFRGLEFVSEGVKVPDGIRIVHAIKCLRRRKPISYTSHADPIINAVPARSFPSKSQMFRTSPVGTALDFDFIWDGYDIPFELTRLIRVS